ncbi:MAG: hypothetical protein GTO46_08650 [Gemmatimonadetes bacterium]|nr:hypothetical protein [Gemmatimonadota bacterium]NIO31702.1 hypothetical protein [Gemmatimonadota bacterium]
MSGATRAGLRRSAREGVTPIVDDVDRKDVFRRRLVREAGDTDITVIASATSAPSDITEYVTLWDMPGPMTWPI